MLCPSIFEEPIHGLLLLAVYIFILSYLTVISGNVLGCRKVKKFVKGF